MQTKELVLLIGLTVLLSVVVSLTTSSLTGNATVAWNNEIGGFPSKVAPEAKTISSDQAIVNLFKNGVVRNGRSGESCTKTCEGIKSQCALGLFSDGGTSSELISCADSSRQADSTRYKISCLCVSPKL